MGSGSAQTAYLPGQWVWGPMGESRWVRQFIFQASGSGGPWVGAVSLLPVSQDGVPRTHRHQAQSTNPPTLGGPAVEFLVWGAGTMPLSACLVLASGLRPDEFYYHFWELTSSTAHSAFTSWPKSGYPVTPTSCLRPSFLSVGPHCAM